MLGFNLKCKDLEKSGVTNPKHWKKVIANQIKRANLKAHFIKKVCPQKKKWLRPEIGFK